MRLAARTARWMMLGGNLVVLATVSVSLAQAETPSVKVTPVVDSSIAAYVPKSGVSGGIAIAGSDTMQPIIAKVASAFRLWQPKITVAVQGGGSYSALGQFLQDQPTIRRGDANPKGHLVTGHVGLLASSRPLNSDERKDFRSRYGFDVTEVPIALDAIAIYVNHQIGRAHV